MSIILKLVFLAIVFVINDALFNTFDKFIVLISSLFFLFYFPLSRKSLVRYAFLSLFAALVFKIAFPLVYIKEGSQIFMYSKSGEFLERNLPAPVFEAMKDNLRTYYPEKEPCEEKDYCWKFYGDDKYKSPARLYEFSADRRRLEKNFSRIVTYINFNSLQSLKLGAVNDIKYNYYANDMERGKMPYYVSYIFPGRAIGSKLCFSGNLLLGNEDGGYRHYLHDSNQCLMLDEKLTGIRLYLFNFNPEKPLTVSTKGMINAKHISKKIVLLGLQFLALFLFVKTDKSRFKNKYVIAILLAIPFNYLYFVVKRMKLWPADFIVYEGGDDGLVHDSKGRWIIHNILDGNWLEALRSDESVFYYMPGLRYLKVPDMFLFGESTYSILLITSIFAVVMSYLIREAFKPHKNADKFSFMFLLIFLFLHLPKSTGLRFEEYIAYSFIGYPGIWSFLLMGIFILYFVRQNACFTSNQAFWLCAALSLSIIVRPNYAVFASIISAYSLYVNRHDYKKIIYMLSGFAVALLPFAHNVYFGDSFHLLTSNALHPANLLVTPADYINAFSDVNSAELVKKQLIGFIVGDQFSVLDYKLISVAFFHIAVLYIIISRMLFLYKFHKHYFYLSVALVAQHSTFLFWRDHRRYMMFILALEVLVAIYAFYAKKYNYRYESS